MQEGVAALREFYNWPCSLLVSKGALSYVMILHNVMYSGVIAGVDWSASDHKEAGPTKKSVAK